MISHLKYSFVILCVVLVAMSCKSSKKTVADSDSNNSQSEKLADSDGTKEPAVNGEAADTTNYFRFIVGFTSRGAGTDREKKAAYGAFLAKEYPNVSYQKVPWGREGETDLCFKLSELSDVEQTGFIAKSKAFLAESDLIQFEENSACRHIRPTR